MHEYEFCVKRSGVWGPGGDLDLNSAEGAEMAAYQIGPVHVNIEIWASFALTKPVSHTTYIPPHSVNTRPQGSYYIGNSTKCDGTRSVMEHCKM